MSQTTWDWIKRDVEVEIATVIDQNRAQLRPLWLHLRGQTRVGKFSTIVRILDAKGYHQKGLFVELPREPKDELSVLRTHLVECQHATSVYTLVLAVERHIRDGHYVVIDEVQRASLSLQSAFQAMIGRIDRDYGEAAIHPVMTPVGGMIVMGSNSAEVDKVLQGTGAPLFGRMTMSISILPFLPYEMSELFQRYNITSARAKVTLWLLTGGYPLLLSRLAEIGQLCNNVDIVQVIRRLMKEDTRPFIDFDGSDECSEFWRTVARIAVGKSQADVVEALETQISDVEDKLRDLTEHKYGVLRYEEPLFPGMTTTSKGERKDQYRIWDPRWEWYREMGTDGLDVASSVQGIPSTDGGAREARTATMLGNFMEQVVVDALLARRSRGVPIIPAWRFAPASASGGAKTRIQWTDQHSHVLSEPTFLRGCFVGLRGDIDGLGVVAIEGHVVYISSTLFEKLLFKEFDNPASVLSTSVAGHIPVTRMHAHALNLSAKLKKILSKLDSEETDEMADVSYPYAAREYASIVASPTSSSYVFITCDLTLEIAEKFFDQFPHEMREDVWVADLNDVLHFPCHKAEVPGTSASLATSVLPASPAPPSILALTESEKPNMIESVEKSVSAAAAESAELRWWWYGAGVVASAILLGVCYKGLRTV